MAMVEKAYALEHEYEELQSFEQRRLKVLDGTAAKEAKKTKRADVIKIAMATLSIFVYMAAVTLLQGKVLALGVQINKTTADIEEMENNILIAELNIGSRSSLEWIEQYATENLGMVQPDSIYYLNQENSLAVNESRQQVAAGIQEEEAEESWLKEFGEAVGNLFNGVALAAPGE